MIDDKLLRQETHETAPGWELDAGHVRLFLTKTGGMHAPVTFFADTASPVLPYGLMPWQEEAGKPEEPPLLRNLRGDFFCLPFGGNGEAVNGELHPCHGDTANAAWTPVKAEKSDGKTVFEFALETKTRPAKVVKHIEIREGESILYLRHTVSGMSGKMPYGHHAILAMPEEGEKMYFSCGKFDFAMTPDTVFSDPRNMEHQFLAVGAEITDLHTVPTMFKNPAVWDYTVYPSPAGYTDLFSIFKRPTDTPAWAAAAYPDRGYLFFTLKNAAVLPATTLWIANSGRYEAPWNGRTRCFGIEDGCGCFADGLKKSVSENVLTRKGWKTCGEFSPDKPADIRLIQGVVRIPATFETPESAEFSAGVVRFTDVKGHTAETKVDTSFLA